ncbi:MAG: flagellar hook-length control protein FliK [Hydrogenoanaerobacterium sp.]
MKQRMEAVQTATVQQMAVPQAANNGGVRIAADSKAALGTGKNASFLDMMKQMLQNGELDENATVQQLNEQLDMIKQMEAKMNENAAGMGMQMMAEMLSSAQPELTDISLMAEQITDAALQKAGLPTGADIAAMQEAMGTMQQGGINAEIPQDIGGAGTPQLTPEQAELMLTVQQRVVAQQQAAIGQELPQEQQKNIFANEESLFAEDTAQAVTAVPQQNAEPQQKNTFANEERLLEAGTEQAAMAAQQGKAAVTQQTQAQISQNEAVKQEQMPNAAVQNSAVSVQKTSVAKTDAGTDKAQAKPQSEPDASMKFGQAVMQAQKMLKAKATTGGSEQDADEAPQDDEAKQKLNTAEPQEKKLTLGKELQGMAQLNAQQGAKEAEAVSTEKLITTEELLAQVKTGVADGLQKGKNEFIIKLKPEGLGEITVKLTELSGGMSLSITAANTQTQKLLSAELAGLREVMRPMGVEVEAVVSRDAGHFNAQQQSQFGAQQNFNAPQEQQQRHFAGYGYSYGTQTDTDDEAQTVQQLSKAQQGLDTYI